MGALVALGAQPDAQGGQAQGRVLKFLLDTNVLLHLVNRAQGYERIARRLSDLQHDQAGLSAIVAVELFRKLQTPIAAAKTAALRSLVADLRIVAFDDVAARSAAAITVALKQQPIGPFDTLIAGHALGWKLTLVTDNVREFSRVPGLRVVNWRA